MSTRQYTEHAIGPRHEAANPATMRRTGWVISGLVILFMLQDGLIKALSLDFAVDATVELGYPEGTVVPIGVTALVCTILYLIPRTARFGAILLTGYLGGAIAAQIRLEDPWLLFPAMLAVLVWVGLAFRDPGTRHYLLP